MHHRSHDHGGGSLDPGEGLHLVGRRVCILGERGSEPRLVSTGVGSVCLPRGLGRHSAGTGKAGGMHPTGMLSYLCSN